MLWHGEINRALAPVFNERLARLGADFARQHLADQRLPEDQKPFTMVLGMRSWAVRALPRSAAAVKASAPHGQPESTLFLLHCPHSCSDEHDKLHNGQQIRMSPAWRAWVSEPPRG